MKIAVINFSGNVGKTTVARHLQLPRIEGAELISVESLNAGEGEGQPMRGRQFGALQEYLQTIDSAVEVPAHFDLVRAFLKAKPIATENAACHLSANEVYGRIRGSGADLATLACDDTDYKALIVKASDPAEQLTLAQKLATKRLALGVVPELDACFAALGLGTGAANTVVPMQRPAP